MATRLSRNWLLHSALKYTGQGKSIQYNDSLRTARSGDRMPIPVSERSEAKICSYSLPEITDSNPDGGMDVCVVCAVQ